MPESHETGKLLGATAQWTAAVHSQEHERPDRLFDDRWAAMLADEEGAAWLAGRPAAPRRW